MKSSSDVVPDPAVGHAAKRVERHVEGLIASRAGMIPEQDFQGDRLGELGCRTESPVCRVELPAHHVDGSIHERHPSWAVVLPALHAPAQRSPKLSRSLTNLVRSLPVRPGRRL